VENEGHADGRRANSVTHELSHVLLEHEPHAVTSHDGSRRWLPVMEDEADWLAALFPLAQDTSRLRNPPG
jgi:Zn-dependent peptidase ImmA (M78 family)